MSDTEKSIEELKKRPLEGETSDPPLDPKKPKTETPDTLAKETTEQKSEDKDASGFLDDQETEEKSKKDNPKYVFGSSTGFGQMSGFKMFAGNAGFSWEEKKKKEKKEVFEEGNKEKVKPETVFGSASVFGSGSSFGNAFQESLTKKSIFDEPSKDSESKEESDNDEDKETDEKETEIKPDVYQKVHLEIQDVKSGEENESTIFQAKAKLYYMELSKASEGWKEKGIGIIKINEYNESPSKLYTSRLVMRQDGNLKLILNLPLIEGFNIVKGMPSSLHADKFLRIQTVDGETPIQYALKLQVDNVTGLYNSIQKHIFKSINK